VISSDASPTECGPWAWAPYLSFTMSLISSELPLSSGAYMA
jgi:hypothetical protein